MNMVGRSLNFILRSIPSYIPFRKAANKWGLIRNDHGTTDKIKLVGRHSDGR